MKNPLFAKIIEIIGYFYERLFHEKVSHEVEKFIKDLSYLGIGTLIATVFSFSFNILAGRWLGPSEYGSFTLVQSVAMFLYIPMMLGFHAALVKYNCRKNRFSQAKMYYFNYIHSCFPVYLCISAYLFYFFKADNEYIFDFRRDFLFRCSFCGFICILYIL